MCHTRMREVSPLPAFFSALGAILLLGANLSAATFMVNIGQGGTIFQDQTSGTSTTTIHVGDTVQWNWVANTHSTTSGTCQDGGYYGSCTPNGGWDSGQHSAPYSFSRSFDQAGSFSYYCSIHQVMMQGTVVVKAGSPPSASFLFSPTGPTVLRPVRFTDTSTGSPTSWAWNFGDASSGADNTSTLQNPRHTFHGAATYVVTLQATSASGTASSSSNVAVSAGEAIQCVPDPQAMCLNDSRFRVTAVWTKPDGTFGPGTAVPLTSDSGYFWFFDPTNIEIVTKVLGACAVNGAYWVFSAGLTNVEVTLTVLDTSNGVSEQYVNPLNTAFQPIQDTAAFETCP